MARHLIVLDWLIDSPNVIGEQHIGQFLSLPSTPFDGADTRLKKMILRYQLLDQHSQGSLELLVKKC